MNLKEKAKQIIKDIPAISLAFGHKSTPLAAKVLAGITIAYALSPVDLIPDFIPVLGYLDDILLLPVLTAVTICLIPKSILEECRLEAEGIWSEGKPKKWFFAIPVVLLWILSAWMIGKAFYGGK